MKTIIQGNFSPFSLMRSMCFVLFVTASGCATNKPITPPEPTDSPDTFAFVPVKEGERDLYVAVSKGDYVLVYTKDGRKLDIVITEADSKKQKIIGKGKEFYKQDYSWVSSPVNESSVDVNFSEIESIEIKLAAPNRSTPGAATVFAVYFGRLWLGGLIVGLFI